nr:hypothetical protein [uncultured Deefgea sp.]
MPALPILFAAESQPDLPLHEQLTRTLRRAILAGHLPLDSRLPATRVLAQEQHKEAAWTAAGQAKGLVLRPLSQFYLDEVKKTSWLLGYASLSNIQISTAVNTLKECIR